MRKLQLRYLDPELEDKYWRYTISPRVTVYLILISC